MNADWRRRLLPPLVVATTQADDDRDRDDDLSYSSAEAEVGRLRWNEHGLAREHAQTRQVEHGVLCRRDWKQCDRCRKMREEWFAHALKCGNGDECTVPFCGTLRPLLRRGETSTQRAFAALEAEESKVAEPSSSSTISTKVVTAIVSPSAKKRKEGEHNQHSPHRAMDVLVKVPPPTFPNQPPISTMSPQDDDVVMHGMYNPGTWTFSGQWKLANHPHDAAQNDFSYTFSGEDVDDPTGSIPCTLCSNADGGPDRDFLVCDLCDRTFHWRCCGYGAVVRDEIWYCAYCAEINAKYLPPLDMLRNKKDRERHRLPPTRLWRGHFMFKKDRVPDSMKLTFKWSSEEEQGNNNQVIAEVFGECQENEQGKSGVCGYVMSYTDLASRTGRGYEVMLVRKYRTGSSSSSSSSIASTTNTSTSAEQ